MMHVSFFRSSPFARTLALGSVLLTMLLGQIPAVQSDTLSPQRIQDLTDLGAQIADREKAMKEAEQQLQNPNLSPADRERLTNEVGDHRDFIKNAKDGITAQGPDQKRVLDRAIEARQKQHQLREAEAKAKADPSDKKAQRTANRLKVELQNDYKDIGTLPPLASAALPGSGTSSNLAVAAAVLEECKNEQLLLSSPGPTQRPLDLFSRHLRPLQGSSPKASLKNQPGQPRLHLVRFRDGSGTHSLPDTSHVRLVNDPLPPDLVREAQTQGIDHADRQYEKMQIEKIPESNRTQAQKDRLKELDRMIQEFEDGQKLIKEAAKQGLASPEAVEAADIAKKAADARWLQRQADALRKSGDPNLQKQADNLDAQAKKLLGDQEPPPLRANTKEPLQWSGAQTGKSAAGTEGQSFAHLPKLEPYRGGGMVQIDPPSRSSSKEPTFAERVIKEFRTQYASELDEIATLNEVKNRSPQQQARLEDLKDRVKRGMDDKLTDLDGLRQAKLVSQADAAMAAVQLLGLRDEINNPEGNQEIGETGKFYSNTFGPAPAGYSYSYVDLQNESGRTVRLKVEPSGAYSGQVPQGFIPINQTIHVTGPDGKPWSQTFKFEPGTALKGDAWVATSTLQPTQAEAKTGTTDQTGASFKPISFNLSGQFTNVDADQVSGFGLNNPILYVTYAQMDRFMEDLYWDEWPRDPEERALQREIQRRINSPEGWNSIMVFQPGVNGNFNARFQEAYEGYRPLYVRLNVNYRNESSYTDVIVNPVEGGGVVGCKKSTNPWFLNVRYKLDWGTKVNVMSVDFGTGGPDSTKQDWLDYLDNNKGVEDLRTRIPNTDTWRYFMAPFGNINGAMGGVFQWRTTIEGHTPVTQLPGWSGHDPNGTRFVAPAPSLNPAAWPVTEAWALPRARITMEQP